MLYKTLAKIIAACILLLTAASGIAGQRFEAVRGVLDLSAWDSKEEPVIALQGEWQFYWMRLDTEEDIAKGKLTEASPDAYIFGPGMAWNQVSPGHFSSFGYVTYVLKIVGLKGKRFDYGIAFDQFTITYRAYLFEPGPGKLTNLGSVGAVAKDSSGTIPQNLKRIYALPDLADEAVYLIVQSSSFILAGGLSTVPTLGVYQKLLSDAERTDWEAFWILGMFCLLFISNFSLYGLRREDKPSLTIALFTLLMGLRYFSTEGMFARLHPEPNFVAATFFYSIIALALPLGMTLYLQFFSLTFPGHYPRWAQRCGWWLCGLYFTTILITLVFPETPNLFRLAMLITAVLSSIMFHRLIFLVRKKERGALLSLLGIALLAAAMANDVFIYLRYYEGPYIGHYGMIAFIFAQSLVVANNFSYAFRTAEHLSQKLQHEVDLQTEKLRLQRDRLEEAQKQLIKVHEELQENDEQKTRFFRTISHELRTPLTLILGTLADSEDQSRLRRSVDIASRHAKRLYRLVNQLLDFQKIALAKISLRTERVDLETFAQGLAQHVEDTCRNIGLSFELSIEANVQGGFIIKAQIDALEKILFNYFGNALKFTPKGGSIKVQLTLVGAYARISVRDSGCGIPKDQQDKLFKLFSQIEGPQQYNKQGTGLGLALVKELAQQMGGRVGVESEVGHGSSFWVEFPRILAETDRHAILYVDNQRSAFSPIQQLFSRHALDSYLHCVETIPDAEALLQQYPVQILIVNAHLGEDIGRLMQIASDLRPKCWRVLFVDPTRQSEVKAISTQGISAIFSLPIGEDFFEEAQAYLTIDLDRRHAPVLDLVYVDDEENIRDSFIKALGTLTLIERYRIVTNADEYREILKHYRIKVVVCDALLSDGQRGIDLLAHTQRLSPDTYRILFTGETSPELLASSIQQGKAQYIIYKPADFAKEFRLIEEIISKSTIEAHEQTLSAEAPPEQGWQLADFAALSQASRESEDQATDSITQAKATILIVDDVSDIRSILHDMLAANGYRVIHADNGRRALERLSEKQGLIDLVITDWVMPEMSGADLIKAMHEQEAFRSIPTVLLTAKSDEQSRSYGLKVGASTYLSKPFDQLELISVVENLLDLKSREREVSELNRFISENVLQRFLPPDLVKDLVAGKAVFDDAAKLLPVTILFADLCEFTSSTDKLGPTRIARILNSFLITMTDVIFAEGGTIDKFIGDAILVIFGAPTPMNNADQISRACRCALAMQEQLAELNKQWLAKEQHSFQMRIGIHHGPAIVGSFGGQRRSDYTAIGHTVNLAARIQSKAEPGQILISSTVRDYIEDESWAAAGSYSLKGVGGDIALYQLKTESCKKIA